MYNLCSPFRIQEMLEYDTGLSVLTSELGCGFGLLYDGKRYKYRHNTKTIHVSTTMTTSGSDVDDSLLPSDDNVHFNERGYSRLVRPQHPERHLASVPKLLRPSTIGHVLKLVLIALLVDSSSSSSSKGLIAWPTMIVTGVSHAASSTRTIGADRTARRMLAVSIATKLAT